MTPRRDGRFDDTRLDALVAVIDDASRRVAYFDALFRELVEGARTATSDVERERYGLEALVVSATLTASRNALAISELERRLEELSELFGARVDVLADVMREHDARAEAAIRDGQERVDALIARDSEP